MKYLPILITTFYLYFTACTPFGEIQAINESYSITAVSGNNQIGFAGQYLSMDLVILIQDQVNQVIEGAEVRIDPNSTGLVILPNGYASDKFGIVRIKWKLGNDLGRQNLVISATNLLNNPSLEITAQSRPYCPNQIEYGGEFYKTVNLKGITKAGDTVNQCWLARNLNIGSQVTGDVSLRTSPNIEKYCYDDLPGNCASFGGLYTWEEAMLIDAPRDSTSYINHQGICPTEWHIPTDDEWKSLERYLGTPEDEINRGPSHSFYRGENQNIGGKLKLGGITGLNLLYGGSVYTVNQLGYSNLNERGSFISATIIKEDDNEVKQIFRRVEINERGIVRHVFLPYGNQAPSLSVRCLKN